MHDVLSNASFLFYLGEAHFKAIDNPLLYFQVLMLSAQFEAVSECLFPCFDGGNPNHIKSVSMSLCIHESPF